MRVSRLLRLLTGMCALIVISAPCRADPPITTARAAHRLPSNEAARHLPVHIRGIVTYYDATIDARRPALFVHDSTGSIFIASTIRQGALKEGALVDVRGVSGPGDFAPIIEAATVKVLSAGHRLPPAPLVTIGEMLSGKVEGQWVEVEGVVRSVTPLGIRVLLELATSGGPVTAVSLRAPGEDYGHLVDAKVKIRATCAPLFNRRAQLTGARLLFAGLGQITVEVPAARDPFELPLLPIGDLMRHSVDLTSPHRKHVRGAVTLQWPGQTICISQGGRSVCASTAQTEPVSIGQVVDLVGFPQVGALNPTLTDASFRSAGERQQTPAPTMTADEGLHGNHDTQLVTIEGKLIGRDNASASTFMLSSGKLLFPIILPGRPGQADPNWEDGSLLRVTGICSVSNHWTDDRSVGFAVPTSFRILLRSPQDVVVLRQPSWWTASHLLPIFATMLSASLCVLAWAVVLRNRLARQTKLVKRQNAELLEISFHDALTGLANRRKFDETLAVELERAARAQVGLSLLMIDIDHFKALNDSRGHQQGDACLVQVAAALVAASMRGSDLIARYGGEEFALILPLCDADGAWAAGERIRVAVLDLLIEHPASPSGNFISVSIGSATVMPRVGASPGSLIAIADQALYHSKQAGRNRTTCASDRVTVLSGIG